MKMCGEPDRGDQPAAARHHHDVRRVVQDHLALGVVGVEHDVCAISSGDRTSPSVWKSPTSFQPKLPGTVPTRPAAAAPSITA